VFTTSPSKVEDAKRLGADEAVLSTDEAQMKKYFRKMHLIIDTVSARHDVNTYLQSPEPDGSVVLVDYTGAACSKCFQCGFGRHSFSGSISVDS